MNAPKRYYRLCLFDKENFISEISDKEFHRLLQAYQMKACYSLRNYAPSLPDDIVYICGPFRNILLIELNRGHF